MKKTFKTVFDIKMLLPVEVELELDDEENFKSEADEQGMRKDSWLKVTERLYDLPEALIKGVDLFEIKVYGEEDDQPVEDQVFITEGAGEGAYL